MADRLDEGQQVRAVILGTIMGTISREDYIIKVREMEEWLDEDDLIQAISVTTFSGLKYRIKVEFEGKEP